MKDCLTQCAANLFRLAASVGYAQVVISLLSSHSGSHRACDAAKPGCDRPDQKRNERHDRAR
jgi:hypothetical protein